MANLAAIPRGTQLVAEASITDLFEAGGHEFVDFRVAIFRKPDYQVLGAAHRAIYRLRPAGAVSRGEADSGPVAS